MNYIKYLYKKVEDEIGLDYLEPDEYQNADRLGRMNKLFLVEKDIFLMLDLEGSTNNPAVTPQGKSYTPQWQSNEIEEIDKVIQDGIRIIVEVL
ncbi:hypothetical protein [Desulfosporosinus sp. OT]|uniref:hypothetical protein n=1 Tax=Desulfosporosinus sp. OT TaxID=913865 RepID=UPI000223A9D9|nr:hypothetical protein [Desulfosporosinus sp. OT]EGW41881.1 hypothetical protein DOT_0180 [Desulfosporosinus sp. OT]